MYSLYFIETVIHQLARSPIFFLTSTATPEIYTLSLHDALPISRPRDSTSTSASSSTRSNRRPSARLSIRPRTRRCRSEEHTSELQSHSDLVCRLLLEKKKKEKKTHSQRF